MSWWALLAAVVALVAILINFLTGPFQAPIADKAGDHRVAHLLGVGWHPTPRAAAAAALEWANVTGADMLYELGCGDGVVAVEALHRGADAVCVERDPAMAILAEAAMRPFGGRARVEVADLFEFDLSDATVVFTFLLPDMNARLRATSFTRLRPGTRVISREFDILGWPCGKRFRHSGVKFLMWQLPVPAEPLLSASRPAEDMHDASYDEDAAVEHMLECGAAEIVESDEEVS